MDLNCNSKSFTTVQCDWENFIDVPYKTIWIWRKEESKTGVQCNVRGGTMICDNDNFTASLSKSSFIVRHNPTGQICHFIPAFKLFGKIHSKSVISLDVSNGGLGVSASLDGKLQVWDNSTGEVRRELTGHAGDIYKCRLFPSGIVVLSAAADFRLKIWSAETGACPVTLMGHSKPVVDVAIIDRGRNVLSVSKDGTALLWHCGEGNGIGTVLSTTDELTCCDIGLVSSSDNIVQVQNPKEVGTGDKIVLVGSEQGNIYGVLLSSRHLTFVVNCSSSVNTILYFSQEMFVVGTGDGRCLIYNLENGSLVRTVHESNSPILSLARFLDKGVLIGRQDGTVTYFNLQSETLDRIHLTGPDCDPVYTICVTSEDVYTGCRDGNIRKYKINDLLAAGA